MHWSDLHSICGIISPGSELLERTGAAAKAYLHDEWTPLRYREWLEFIDGLE